MDRYHKRKQGADKVKVNGGCGEREKETNILQKKEINLTSHDGQREIIGLIPSNWPAHFYTPCGQSDNKPHKSGPRYS